MNSIVRPIFNKKVAKKEICESREQCTRSTSVHCPPLIWPVKEIVGLVHSARDLLTDKTHVKTLF